jgi:hypothetical protein
VTAFMSAPLFNIVEMEKFQSDEKFVSLVC